MLAIPFPDIDPILVSIGPFAIRWYALAYIVGLILGWRYCLRLSKHPPSVATPQQVDDFLVWATLGVVLGGRIGYVVFYNPMHYLNYPVEALYLWHGGMSFHGGALGVLFALFLFSRQRKIDFLGFSDIIVSAAPIGLFFGRIANFINAELWGRVTDLPWGVVFPGAGPEPRHPSQLYEAALEGLVLFVLLNWLRHFTGARYRRGVLVGVFLAGYAVARTAVEFVRQPDEQLGFLIFGATMGQLLSLPLLLLGLYLIWRATPYPPEALRNADEPAR